MDGFSQDQIAEIKASFDQVSEWVDCVMDLQLAIASCLIIGLSSFSSAGGKWQPAHLQVICHLSSCWMMHSYYLHAHMFRIIDGI